MGVRDTGFLPIRPISRPSRSKDLVARAYCSFRMAWTQERRANHDLPESVSCDDVIDPFPTEENLRRVQPTVPIASVLALASTWQHQSRTRLPSEPPRKTTVLLADAFAELRQIQCCTDAP